VRDVEFPELVLGAKLGRLAEEFLHQWEVLSVPVDLGLRHEDRDVPVQQNKSEYRRGGRETHKNRVRVNPELTSALRLVQWAKRPPG